MKTTFTFRIENAQLKKLEQIRDNDKRPSVGAILREIISVYLKEREE